MISHVVLRHTFCCAALSHEALSGRTEDGGVAAAFSSARFVDHDYKTF